MVILCLLCVALPLLATETENQGLRILPAAAKMAIDGNTADWNLAGGIFACGDVEHLRDQFAIWVHAQADAEHLYLLARWKDPTPLNNPELKGGHGFNGDCLQVRFVLFPGTKDETTSWWDFWRDAKGVAVLGRGWPGPRNGVSINPLEALTPADEQAVRQAYRVDADGKGYTQEIAIPWKLLSVTGAVPAVGERLRMTVEPNFTAGSYGRITIKDLFNPQSKTPDRIFTFRAYRDWGWATRVAEAGDPQPVRLADNRTFPVTMQDKLPVVDWTGVVKKFSWPGFKPITFTMPFDGVVSLNIIAPDGTVARHLLNAETRGKGVHTVQWDGLTDATYRTPGQPVAAGDYTWKALAHPGAKLTYRGAACIGGRVPWQAAAEDYWLGDHGEPSAVVTDSARMYLACNGAEGGRHLLATDFTGKLLWGLQNTVGGADPEHIAVADGVVYVLHPKAWWSGMPGMLTRVDAATGGYLPWPGTRSHILNLGEIWPKELPGLDHFEGIAAHGDKVYLTASDPSFFKEDVADWKALIKLIRADNPLAKRIYREVNPDTTTRLDQFLTDKTTQEKAFATWTGGPRFDNEVVNALNSLLPAVDLVPNADKLTAPARALANRRFLETALGQSVRLLPADALVVLDIATGKVAKTWPLPLGGAITAVSDTQLYVVSGGTEVLAIDPTTGKTSVVVKGLRGAYGVATDAAGKLFVSVHGSDMQVQIFTARGKKVGAIGRKGGRAPLGPWQADGVFMPAGIAIDRENKLWVMEHDSHPKRVSVWNLKTGALVKDFFGPTHYGASGGAINPRDPNLMVGVGCEWRMDPKTGTSTCLGTFDRRYHGFATYREGKNGKLYLYTYAARYGLGGVQVWERLGDARYAKRAELRCTGDFRKGPGQVEIWVDANGDGKDQPDELQRQEGALFTASSNGWSLNLGPDHTLYALDWKDRKLKALPADGFNACGAPVYRLAALRTMPDAMSEGYENNAGCALPSADNTSILINTRVRNHPAGFLWRCFDLATGALKWTYPNPYFQVHGSHSAPPPEVGLFRGAFGPVGAVTVPGAGPAWVINGNVGDWNVLTADGFYHTRLFNGNIFEVKWPADATPGADMTDVPPGCGGEDFGGSATQGADGKLYIQSGKMAVWNLALSGMESTPIPGGTLTMTEADTRTAFQFREAALQANNAGMKVTAKRATVTLTGNINADFKGATVLDYGKMDDARVRTTLAYDDTRLYVGWEVRDTTPWVNGATDIAQMYAAGDTVDLQLGTDANLKRADAVKGDLRLSIGNFGGKPTAVLYKFVSADKRPRLFTSGVIKGYQVDWVDVLTDADIKVRLDKDRYTVEVAVPLATLGLAAKPGQLLHGDVGVTHGEAGGTRTKLRSYWSNQQTGLVDDVVFELKLTPANWGEITLE
jgi:hypothetical protein